MADNSDRPSIQARRLALMIELFNAARDIALQSYEREQEPEMLSVFKEALVDCLRRENCDKNDLVNIWAMLQLGSRAIRDLSLGTDQFDFGPQSEAWTTLWKREERTD